MKIKLVIWDLDNTIWDGTLAEKEKLIIRNNRVEIIKKLNAKGIMNSICSKNEFVIAKDFLFKNGLWDLFVFPKISFDPKGKIVKQILNEMHLREENAVFIDDNISNLNEVLYYNPKIKVCDEKDCELILHEAIQFSKDDIGLKRLKQYRQLEIKTKAARNFSNNDDFLRESNIKITFLSVENEDLFERLFELSERANQLNFTKNRMSKDELANMIANSDIDTKLIQAEDNFGNYGIIGFYSLYCDTLIHFVFSCRIMNMGIEQFIYQYLNCPKIGVRGSVATNLSRFPKIDYITVEDNIDVTSKNSISNFLSKNSEIKILGIGACDLYHPIAYFSMPNHYFKYECNVFVGNERGVNVGTEYLRSQMEMNDNEKEFCRTHFMNYTRHNVFRSELYTENWDYIIMSFHDDMVYKIYEHKQDANLRVVLSPESKFGQTSVINISNKQIDDPKIQRQWLDDNFKQGVFISADRFLNNLLWLAENVYANAKIVLITGPELNFFREQYPTCEEVREQIKKLNKIIRILGKKYSNKFIVVEINNVIRSRNDVTNYIFHLTASTAHSLFVEIASTIANKGVVRKEPMLENLVQKRRVCILGENKSEILNAYYNLRLGNVKPFGVLTLEQNFKLRRHFLKNKFQKKIHIWFRVNRLQKFLRNKSKYYFVIADNKNYESIKENLIERGFVPVRDFIQLKEIKYKKHWNDQNNESKNARF